MLVIQFRKKNIYIRHSADMGYFLGVKARGESNRELQSWVLSRISEL